jgi:hypothetical protein
MLFVGTLKAEKGRILQKIHADKDERILDYVKDLKEMGYEIIQFPKIEKFRNYYVCNVIYELPQVKNN